MCGVTGGIQSVKAARAMLHFWEEPPISGSRGSGAVFFSGCPLRCVFCQNAEISGGKAGREIPVERLAEVFLELQERGAHNINLVTPTHYVPQIKRALELAGRFSDEAGTLDIPVVYNTGGYETPETIRSLAGYVDVYLTDFKYASAALAARYSHAADYPDVALAAFREMVAQVGDYASGLIVDDKSDELLTHGVIVRQLLLPCAEGLQDAKAVTALLFGEFENRICYSLMNQYTPMPGMGERFPELAEPVLEEDYAAWVDFALDLGIEWSFMQEGGTVEESFIPAFDGDGL